MVLKKAKHHWAFLEEIDAPLWVDLTLEEAKSNRQDIDDEWFCTSHLFHRCSSRQLKAAFSHASEESVDADLDLPGPSSPKLPSSVSRSRGKDYKNKNWRGDNNCDVSLNKQHPVKVLSGKSSLVDSGSSEKIKPRSTSMKPKSSRVGSGSGKEIKPKLSFVNSKGTSNLKRSLVCDRSSIGNARGMSSWVGSGSREEIKPKLSFVKSKGTTNLKRSLVCERSSIGNAKGMSLKPISICEGLESSLSSMVDVAGESSTGSTVTSESNPQGQQKFLEVSSRAFGHMSGLLSAVRITLRKSHITRQASRVETCNGRRQSMEINNKRRQSRININNGRRESRDHKSSSSKCSVGSSSVPGFDVKSSKFISIRKKNKTPDSRNVETVTEAPTNRVKVSNVSKVSTVQFKDGNFNSRKGDKTTVSKSNYKGTGKSKVQTLRAKSSLPLRVNDQNSFTGALKAREKVGFAGLNVLVGDGKENGKVKLCASEKSNGRKNPSGGIARGQNAKKQNVLQKGDTRGLDGPKGKIRDQSGGKNSMHVNQRIHLR